MSLKRLFSFSYCTTLPSAVSHQSQFVYTLIKVIAEVNTLSLQVNFLRDDNFLFVQKQSACFQVLISSTTDRCSGSSVPFSNVTTKQSVHIRLHKKKSPVVDYYLCTQQWVSKKIQFKSSDLINDVKNIVRNGSEPMKWLKLELYMMTSYKHFKVCLFFLQQIPAVYQREKDTTV